MKLLNFTLSDLEDRLDSLTEGALCQLSARDYERLFGVKNAAVGRLRNFAKLHAYFVSFRKGAKSRDLAELFAAPER